jgi:UDP-sugar transporter A1/2/3
MLKTDKRALGPLDVGEVKVSWRLRLGILVCLCFQNAGHALLARYSQSIREESYSSTEVVLVSELIKVIVTAVFTLTDKNDSESGPYSFSRLTALLLSAQKVIVLVILYSIANLLSYYALARVDAAVYTVLLQLKILTTASFSVLFLGSTFSGAKLRALLLLVLGCVLVASPTFNQNNRPVLEKSNTGTDDEGVSIFEAVLGISAILVMVTISGYSAVYFESMLKNKKTSVWEYNFQLAFYSSLLLISIIISERGYSATQKYDYDFFKGWTISAVVLSLIQAAGGLLVAASLKYADSILKTLATSGSIVLSAIVGYLLLDAPLDIFVVIGCLATILAIVNYTLDATSMPSNNNANNNSSNSS